MTLFKIDSIVPDHTTIAIPSPSLTSGTTVHVALQRDPFYAASRHVFDLLKTEFIGCLLILFPATPASKTIG